MGVIDPLLPATTVRFRAAQSELVTCVHERLASYSIGNIAGFPNSD
jgi:hypothetical protein